MPTVERVLVHAVQSNHPYFTPEKGWCWASLLFDNASKIEAIHFTKANDTVSNIPHDEYDHPFLFVSGDLSELDFILISYEDKKSFYVRINHEGKISRFQFELPLKGSYMKCSQTEEASVLQEIVAWSIPNYWSARPELLCGDVDHLIPRAIFKEDTGLPYEQHYADFLLQQTQQIEILSIAPMTRGDVVLPNAQNINQTTMSFLRHGGNSIFNEAHSSREPVVGVEIAESHSCNCIVM
ncbi:hypothetical protein N9Q05_00030 [bacterium]|nr:hypothetical protein [bacterium]